MKKVNINAITKAVTKEAVKGVEKINPSKMANKVIQKTGKVMEHKTPKSVSKVLTSKITTPKAPKTLVRPKTVKNPEEVKVLGVENPKGYIPALAEDEIAVLAMPMLYKVQLFRSPDGRTSHYLVDLDGYIFDHFNNLMVSGADLLGRSNEHALLFYNYNLKNPWFGNMQAVRDRLLRRGSARAANRTAIIDENGNLLVLEDPSVNFTSPIVENNPGVKLHPNQAIGELGIKMEPSYNRDYTRQMLEAEEANLRLLQQLQYYNDLLNLQALDLDMNNLYAAEAGFYKLGGKVPAWKISFRFRFGGRF